MLSSLRVSSISALFIISEEADNIDMTYFSSRKNGWEGEGSLSSIDCLGLEGNGVLRGSGRRADWDTEGPRHRENWGA